MSEKAEKKEEKEESKAKSEGDATGDKSEASNLVEAANIAAKRLEEANTKAAELVRQQQELIARQALGGQTAGASQEEKKEETPAEYAKKVMEGKE